MEGSVQITAAQRVMCALFGLGALFSDLQCLESSPSSLPLAGIAPAVSWISVVAGLVCVAVAALPQGPRG
jgi:hypothetical protein